MKIKFLISLIVIVFSIFIIYIFNIDREIYYFNIIDKEYEFKTYNEFVKENIHNLEKYVNMENKNDYRITDLIRDIQDNIKVEEKNIQNILIKADMITIMIGNSELNYKLKNTNVNEVYDYIDEFLRDMKNLMELTREYSKETIYFIGFYDKDEYLAEFYAYINVRMKDLCEYYSIEYIEIKGEFNEELNVNISKKILKQ